MYILCLFIYIYMYVCICLFIYSYIVHIEGVGLVFQRRQAAAEQRLGKPGEKGKTFGDTRFAGWNPQTEDV